MLLQSLGIEDNLHQSWDVAFYVFQHGLLFENQAVVSHLQWGVVLHGERVAVEEPVSSTTVSPQEQAIQTAPAAIASSHPLLVKELKDGQNFIGFLQQLCQTLAWELPVYEFSGETPEFICTCSIWADGQRFRGRAISSQKKKAKYFAAKVVLLNLQQDFKDNSIQKG